MKRLMMLAFPAAVIIAGIEYFRRKDEIESPDGKLGADRPNGKTLLGAFKQGFEDANES
jgi:hypothetical protein